MERARPSILDHLGQVPPTTLYHYTSLHVLLEIVKHGKLWASNLRYLNDTSEFAYSLRIFQDRLLVLHNNASEEERKTISTLVGLTQKGMKRDAFIASFSQKRDDLSQWRAYCPPGQGVCIGFKSSALRTAINPVFDDKGKQTAAHLASGISLLAKVIYIGDDYGPSFDKVIKQACGKELGTTLFGVDPAYIVHSMLSASAPFYKNAAFKDEDEWRILVGQSPETGKTPNVLFREGKSTLVPYTEIEIQAFEPNFLSEIIVGPSPNIELSVDAIKEMLHLTALSNAVVKPSDVPYRHW